MEEGGRARFVKDSKVLGRKLDVSGWLAGKMRGCMRTPAVLGSASQAQCVVRQGKSTAKGCPQLLRQVHWQKEPLSP